MSIEEENQQYTPSGNKLLADGFLVNWRANEKQVSLYILWSSISGLPTGESIFCRGSVYEPPNLIRKAQEALTGLGYNPGPVDGFWGNKTKYAIFSFQKKVGIEETGQLDSLTLEKLRVK
ncbi:peptidoglycan-binding domain-containing protein [endosymbiont of Lamellibrachia barhami]|uniref:peptidoglycan-binding domain-containing protein n=1 Tax=endosymbiont of Lamellibrachia barhami TaxID=205975 RepID=UPI0015B12511|nr:peptidoglycan-binding domain-containing protein [endosymbiont of Lamellibrachia barhami]